MARITMTFSENHDGIVNRKRWQLGRDRRGRFVLDGEVVTDRPRNALGQYVSAAQIICNHVEKIFL